MRITCNYMAHIFHLDSNLETSYIKLVLKKSIQVIP